MSQGTTSSGPFPVSNLPCTDHCPSDRTVVISCPILTNRYPWTCHQRAMGGGQIRSTSQILQSGDVMYSAVSVTATMNGTTAEATSSTRETSPVSTTAVAESSVTTGAAAAVTGAGWVSVGAVVGGGLVVLGL